MCTAVVVGKIDERRSDDGNRVKWTFRLYLVNFGNINVFDVFGVVL